MFHKILQKNKFKINILCERKMLKTEVCTSLFRSVYLRENWEHGMPAVFTLGGKIYTFNKKYLIKNHNF